MTLSDETAQLQIRAEVGDPNNTLAIAVAAMWGALADKGAVSWQLRYLYTKRSAIDVRLAEEQGSTDYTLGRNEVGETRSQRFDHLVAMRADVQAEIVRVEALTRAGRAPATAALTAVEPVTPPYPNSPDASSDVYRGSPYRPTRLRY